MHSCPGISPNYHPLPQAGCVKTRQLPATHALSVLNRSQGKKHAIKCSQISFYFTNKIANREVTSNKNCKPFNNYCVPVTLQDGYASKPEEEDHPKNFQNIFLKNLNALYRFIRPYACAGVALVPAVLMHIYVAAVNQLYDVEIDKVNKPYLPLASGEFSMGTGIAITLGSVLMSLAIAIMLRSPPLILGVIVWFLFGTAYSVQLPFLRWKRNSYLAAISIMFLNGFLQQFPFFVHIQDLHDVDDDKEFGIETLSVRLGKERVFWLCVYMLSIAYGGAVVVGASSSFLLSKLITIIGHSILASFLWLRAQTVDLSNNASTFSFYMFIWQLYYADYLLIPFVR